jgi:hypothetical protein
LIREVAPEADATDRVVQKDDGFFVMEASRLPGFDKDRSSWDRDKLANLVLDSTSLPGPGSMYNRLAGHRDKSVG